MSYSTAEAAIDVVVDVLARATVEVDKLHRDSERIVARLNGSTAGLAPVETEIDTEAGLGSVLWIRLQERKDQIKLDMAALKSAAEAIETAIQSNLP